MLDGDASIILLWDIGYICRPNFSLTKYRIVKNTNNKAMNTPTASAKKNSTVEDVFPTKESEVDVLVGLPDEVVDEVEGGVVEVGGGDLVSVDMMVNYSAKRYYKNIKKDHQLCKIKDQDLNQTVTKRCKKYVTTEIIKINYY